MNTVICAGNTITPSKLVCVGRNYVAHAKELGNEVPSEPVIFFKPNSSIADTLSAFHEEPLHYEAELCFLIENGALAAVGAGLDLTKRALQTRLKSAGLPWERAKAFDGAAVFSKFVPLSHALESLVFSLSIDGLEAQFGDYPHMLFKPDTIVEACKKFVTFSDGDILMTGTPQGVGELKSGSVYQVTVSTTAGDVLVQHSWCAV